MTLGPANGFGAPLWQLEPAFDVVADIIRDARSRVRWTGGDATALGRQAWLRKVMAVSDGLLAAEHIYVEGGP